MAMSMRKRTGKTFEETCKPIWDEVRRQGLTEKDVDALVKEAVKKAREPTTG